MNDTTPVFADGFGRRVVRVESGDAGPAEHLLLSPDLASNDAFVAALTDRMTRLYGRRFTSYARLLRMDGDDDGSLSVVTDYTAGWRLADMLDVAESENLTFDIGVVMLLLRQLLPTANLLSTQFRDAASGALGPEHVLVTPQGRLVLTDYVFGTAIDALGWDADALWTRLRIATPADANPGQAVTPRADVLQLGVTVLSLVLGRRLRDTEFPARLADLVAGARQKTPAVVDAPLSSGLRDWLLRALQLGPKNFEKLFDAQLALERLLASDPALLAQPAELDAALTRFARFVPVVELPTSESDPYVTHESDRLPRAGSDRTRAGAEPPSAIAQPAAEVPPAIAEGVPVAARKSGVRKKKSAAAKLEHAVTEAPTSTAELAATAEALEARAAELAGADEIAAFVPTPAAEPALPAESELAAEPEPELEPMPPSAVASAPDSEATPSAACVWGLGTETVEPIEIVPTHTAHDDTTDTPNLEADADPWRVPAAGWAVPPPIEHAAIAEPWWRSTRWVAALIAVAVIEALLLGWQLMRPSASLGGDGEIVVQSRPEGARVVIDDRDYGVTPLTVRVKPGTRVLQLTAGNAEPRVIPLTIRPGVQTAQYVELAGVTTTGTIEVRSEPSQARVTIDGERRGSTPLTLRDVAPGDYQVVLERNGWKSTQVVRVEAGGTAQLVVPIR